MLAMESAVLDRGRQAICADQNLYAAFPASCVANCNKQFVLNFIYCVIPAWAAPTFFLEFRAHFHTMISNPFHNFLFVCNLFDLFSKSGVRCCVISEACKIGNFGKPKPLHDPLFFECIGYLVAFAVSCASSGFVLWPQESTQDRTVGWRFCSDLLFLQEENSVKEWILYTSLGCRKNSPCLLRGIVHQYL